SFLSHREKPVVARDRYVEEDAGGLNRARSAHRGRSTAVAHGDLPNFMPRSYVPQANASVRSPGHESLAVRKKTGPVCVRRVRFQAPQLSTGGRVRQDECRPLVQESDCLAVGGWNKSVRIIDPKVRRPRADRLARVEIPGTDRLIAAPGE